MFEDSDPESPRLGPILVGGLLILVVAVWGLAWFLAVRYLPDWQTRGTFGDSFGAVNALFSGLAFAGIILALHFQRLELKTQREELSAQREELVLTREELKRSATAQEHSQHALQEQVMAMKATARLNAMSALVENYLKTYPNASIPSQREMIKNRIRVLVENMENELQTLEELV